MISPDVTVTTVIDNTLIVSVNEVGKWLNLSPSAILTATETLKNLILTATEIIENYSWLSLRKKTFQAEYELTFTDFYNFWNGNLKLSLERAPILDLDNILSIEYLDNNNQWVVFDRGVKTIDGLYENVTEKQEGRGWASVYFVESIPFQSRINAYKIRITFQAGYDPTETDIAKQIPVALKTAIMEIVAFHYSNRGDCQETTCNLNGYPVPCGAKGIIDNYSVAKTIIGGAYNLGWC